MGKGLQSTGLRRLVLIVLHLECTRQGGNILSHVHFLLSRPVWALKHIKDSLGL